MKNPGLKVKMDALGWLARSAELVAEELCQKMLTAYRDSEMPLTDVEARLRYNHQVTDSTAMITAAQVISDTLGKRASLAYDLAQAKIDPNSYIVKRLRWPIQVVELLACNREAAINALRNTNLVSSLNDIISIYGLEEQSIVDTTALIKLSARILATVMNHAEAKYQFIEESTEPLINLFHLMTESKAFDAKTQVGITDQIEFVANGLKVVRLLTSHPNYTAKIQNNFPDFVSMIGGILSQYFENSVIQSEGRAVLQNWAKVKQVKDPNMTLNYSSNYLQRQRKT